MPKQVFRHWDVSQHEMFPPALRDLVPESHLVHFVRRVVVEDLDLSGVYAKYTATKGQPPYDPRLMTALLLYSYCRGVYSSRRIELSCEERLDVRALVGRDRERARCATSSAKGAGIARTESASTPWNRSSGRSRRPEDPDAS